MADTEDFARATDRIVGAAIRAQRDALHLSQTELAAAIGVTHQQLSKYERGRDRVGAGTLAVLAEHLGRDIGWFFDVASGEAKLQSHRAVLPLDDLLPDFVGDGLLVRVSFTRDAEAAWPGLMINTVTLIGAAGGAAHGRAPTLLPHSLYPAMLRHGAAALLAIVDGDGAHPRAGDGAARAVAALN